MSSEVPRPQESTTSNYQKYQTRNPLAKGLIGRFMNRVVTEIDQIRPERIIDLGCGEGLIAARVSTQPYIEEYRGYDINPAAIAIARSRHPDLHFEVQDFLQMELEPGWADLTTCLEVLEHLPEPRMALERIYKSTARHALISVPWEPYFRVGNFLRGKYLRTLGNHPEHIQHFSKRSFELLVTQVFPSVQVSSCFPWLLAIARK